MQQEIPDKQKVNACPLCNVEFKSKDILDNHIQRHSEEKSFTCEKCNKIYARKDSLYRHRKCHLEEKHRKCHIKENSFKCRSCDITFEDKSQLQRHLIAHKVKKPYVCELCNKNFSSLRYLKVHRLYHTGERPYSCEICNKGFATLNKLNDHRRVLHVDKKPFQICDESLSSEIDINLSDTHSENSKNPYVCEMCSRRCKTDAELAAHKHFHEKRENISMESKADALRSENSEEDALIYSHFMRKNSNTYGNRSKNVAKDND